MSLEHLHFVVLFGKTGCGKSEILAGIKKKGGQVIDLEILASHNGSSFGGLGKKPQPSQSEFEESIKKKIASFTPELPVWIEYESGYLGNLQIPEDLLQKTGAGKMIAIDLGREQRINRIIKSYSSQSSDDLIAATSKLKKKLSQGKYRLVRQSIRQKNFKTAVSVLITYYDKVYEKGLNDSKCGLLGTLKLTDNNYLNQASQVLDFYNSASLKSRNPE